MSTVLKSYDWSFVSRNNKKARSRTYPWDLWFDGRIHELHPKEDFDGPATSLERVIRTSANRRDIKVRIRIDSGNVVMQQHDGDEPLRTVTKSPSLRSIKAAQAAAEATTNGDAAPAPEPPKPAKRAVKRQPAEAALAPVKTFKRRRTPAAV